MYYSLAPKRIEWYNMNTKKTERILLMCVDVYDFLQQCGVVVNSQNKITSQSKFVPKFQKTLRDNSLKLIFPGPRGFGQQEMVFDIAEYNACFRDAQFKHSTPKDEYLNFFDNLLGCEWRNSELKTRVAIVLYCFSLSPIFIVNAKSSKRIPLKLKESKTLKLLQQPHLIYQ